MVRASHAGSSGRSAAPADENGATADVKPLARGTTPNVGLVNHSQSNYRAGMDIGGSVATEYERVLEAFVANFDERGEVGAALCVYLDGEPVVDLWGGLA